MIEIGEYYAQAEETAANSNNASKWGNDVRKVFPIEGINIVFLRPMAETG